jgi:hypothetical protein
MTLRRKRPVGRPPNVKIARLIKKHGCSRATAYRMAAQKQRLRAQSTHSMEERGLDAYPTCPQAVISLLYLERAYLPRLILDPCAGLGAFTTLMAQFGYETHANDIFDYGLEGCSISDYLTMEPLPGIEAVVTNPPYAKAVEFLKKALGECGYVAFLLRSMWLADGDGRDDLLERHPPVRTYHLKRLPMMHRLGYAGPRSTSNVPHSLIIWDRRANHVEPPQRVRWKDIWREYEAGRLNLGPLQPRHDTTRYQQPTEKTDAG